MHAISWSDGQINLLPWKQQLSKQFLGDRCYFVSTNGFWDKIPRKPCKAMAGASISITAQPAIQIASTLFTFGTALVVPFYTVMILAPHAEWTKRMVESNIPYAVLGIVYLYLLSLSWTSETLKLMFASKYWLPELPGITKMFSSTLTVASAWIHLLAVDLFAGRHVFLDGLQHSVETRHSLVLCLLFCPIGIVSHFITKVATVIWRRVNNEKEAANMATLYS